jgi:hypothetical protein
VIGDATATTKWQAYTGLPLLTQCQIRQPYYGLYNIVAYDGVSTLTLDRNWTDPDGAALSYMIYQAYFASPVSDFRRFYEIRDTTNNAPMDYWSKSRMDLSVEDPQRTIFNQPSHVVPYQTDTRAASATLGYMLFELWPHPLSVLPYSFSYERRGDLLVKPADTLPSPLTESMVKWKTREVAFLFKEAQKGDGVKRGEGADWRFLAQAAAAEYEKVRKTVAARDRDLIDLYFKRFVRDASRDQHEPFATINLGTPSAPTSQLGVGGW